MEITCRRLTEDDLDLILSMNHTFRKGFAEPAAARAFLQNPSNWFWAAIRGKTVVGFAYGYVQQRLGISRPVLYLNEVGVAEAMQRQGIGFAMMAALKAACLAAGIGKYFLYCSQNNAGANALYRKLGGEIGVESGGSDRVYYFPLT